MSTSTLPGDRAGSSSLRDLIARALTPRVVFGMVLAATIATWIMLLIGGTVNPTGSSLACDWSPSDLLFPTCNGAAFPEMKGGVLFEHGHRLWGWLVGIFTTATLIGAWAGRDIAPNTRWMALGAFFLVLAQGALGGLTVVLGLNPYVSTGHLVVGYSFLATMVVLTWRLAPSRRATPTLGTTLPRGTLTALTLLALGQIVLGGVIRHFGAGFACGADPIGCSGQGLWPALGLGKLHMAHRLLGYLVAVLVLVFAWRARRSALAAGRNPIAALALLPIALVLAQVGLGLLTVMTREVIVVAFHTAFGGLLLANLVALRTGFGPLGDQTRAAAPAKGARA
jgi:heme A synthase